MFLAPSKQIPGQDLKLARDKLPSTRFSRGVYESQATKFCTVAPNIYVFFFFGSSPCNLLQSPFLAPTVFFMRWLPDFGKKKIMHFPYFQFVLQLSSHPSLLQRLIYWQCHQVKHWIRRTNCGSSVNVTCSKYLSPGVVAPFRWRTTKWNPTFSVYHQYFIFNFILYGSCIILQYICVIQQDT